MKEETWQKCYENGSMFNVKILYKNGGHKYAHIFKVKDYELGRQWGTIVGFRKMNFIEKFVFRNCL